MIGAFEKYPPCDADSSDVRGKEDRLIRRAELAVALRELAGGLSYRIDYLLTHFYGLTGQ
jgi:hypothetical protein